MSAAADRDVSRAAHLALDAAIEAARIRGARGALAARTPAAGAFGARVRTMSAAADTASDRATRAAHDALDLLVVAIGGQS